MFFKKGKTRTCFLWCLQFFFFNISDRSLRNFRSYWVRLWLVTDQAIYGLVWALQNQWCSHLYSLKVDYLECSRLTKWSNTLKKFVGKLPTNCLSVFDHFVRNKVINVNSWVMVLLLLSIQVNVWQILWVFRNYHPSMG